MVRSVQKKGNRQKEKERMDFLSMLPERGREGDTEKRRLTETKMER